jgi:ubiquinone/menaquinone biosynthesis C-methylase UbiE
MVYTQEQLERDGYLIKAAPFGDWREYDQLHPVPNYFDFDWISARHPDLYHRFALSTEGLMRELDKLVNLSGLDVIDVGAGTGRSAMAAARKARSVTAVDIYESVVLYGKNQMRLAGLNNLSYLQGNRDELPLSDHSFDALINSWAELNYLEAYRVLKPGSYLIRLGAPLEALCGELTSTLARVFPDIIQAIAPREWYDIGYPETNSQFDDAYWNDLPVIPPTLRHDFTYVAEYGDYQETAAIFGRLYGPKARQYFLDRQQSHYTSRLRIEVCRVKKWCNGSGQ